MTDMEKLLKGLNLIKNACHNANVLEDFHVINVNPNSGEDFKGESYQVTFMIASGYGRESLIVLFDKDGNYISVVF